MTDVSKLSIGYDPASPDGDESALTLAMGGTLYHFLGDEADFLKNFLTQSNIAVLDEAMRKAETYILRKPEHSEVKATPLSVLQSMKERMK